MDKWNAVSGKKIIFLYRVLGDKEAATGIAFSTENSESMSADTDSIATKDGKINSVADVETELSMTSLLTKEDAIIGKLEDAMVRKKKIEIWKVNLEVPADLGGGKFKGKYYQGYLTEKEETSNAEDNVEISMTFAIDGAGVKGDVTVTKAQQEEATYVFKDTTAEAAAAATVAEEGKTK